mmetsp:Transcript_41227/g.76681  ORF Transcript_41227/g.76681 Transcript_41227/m.76681 type:complete len:644 (+) Transcript_41227:44-1975(+)
MADSARGMVAEENESPIEEDLTKNPPLPGHVQHHCTDVKFLLFFVLVSAGVGWISWDAIQHGNLRRLEHGYFQAKKVCGGSSLEDSGLVFWCLNETRDGLLTDDPLCLKGCPEDSLHSHACHDSDKGTTKFYQDYPSHYYGRICKPTDKELSKKVFPSRYQQRRSMILRLWSALSRTWFVLVLSTILTVSIGYTYVFFLFQSPEVVATWCTVVLTLLPISTGFWMIYTTSHPDSVLAVDLWESELTDLETYLAGSGLMLFGMVALCIATAQRDHVKAATICLDTAGDCLLEEWSVLLEPFISVTLKVSLAMLGIFVLFNVASRSVAEADIVDDDPSQYIGWSTQEQSKLLLMLIYLIWLEEAIVATSRYVMAYATEVWYFTEPEEDGQRSRGFTCILLEAYCNVVRYHIGSMAMGSFIYVFGRIPAFVLGIFRYVGLGDRCCYVDVVYNMAFGASGAFAYMDLPLTSTGYFRGGVRAVQVLSDEIRNVHRLQGALWIFHLAGVGVCTAGPAYIINAMIQLVPSFSDPRSDLFIWDTGTVFISTGLIGLLIGRSLMLVFDTVFDTIIYCYALQMRREKQAELNKMMLYDRDGDGVPDYLCFLPRPADSSDEEGAAKDAGYAPKRLMEVLNQHRLRHKDEEELSE